MTRGERVRIVRKALGFTLEKFGGRIGLRRSSLSQIETGVKELTEANLLAICREDWDGKFVNEDWLRTGAGEMFKERLPQDEVASYVEDLLESDGNPFYEVIIGMMKAYHEMDETSRQAALEFFRRLKENLEK